MSASCSVVNNIPLILALCRIYSFTSDPWNNNYRVWLVSGRLSDRIRLWTRFFFHFVIVACFMFLTAWLSLYKWNQPWHTHSKYPVFAKQNRSTEGCSKLKKSVDITRSGKMVSTLEQMQVPNGTGPGVRRSKRPLFASRTRCNVL